MADRPILFSAPMVRALLNGRKTQTRRIMKVQPPKNEDFPGSYFGVGRKVADGVKMYSLNDYDRLPKHPTKWDLDGSVGVARDAGYPREYDARFAIGDRLWVKETWNVFSFSQDGEVAWPLSKIPTREQFEGVKEQGVRGVWHVIHRESDQAREWFSDQKWRVSIHMPRWASRLTLTVTDVRVQRLQDCSEADAIAEGIERFACIGGNAWRDYGVGDGFNVRDPGNPAQRSYATLWDSLNGAGAWDANPWVVAVSFDVRNGNIDA